LTWTALHIQHIEQDDPGLVVPYWHDQHLLISELDLSVARGLRPGLGLSVTLPFRIVRDRIKFEDLARQPYVPPNPDTHHRNETLNHIADGQLEMLLTRKPGPWTVSAGLGTSVPVGKTEPNPFELGRLGLPHQHIQFGTGTWDPILNLLAARSMGAWGFNASSSARFSFYENGYGYQPGNRFSVAVSGTHGVGGAWTGSGGMSVNREQAERWSGRIEEEGNLGRTDLLVQAGLTHASPAGSFGVAVQVPIVSWVTGEQAKFPAFVSLTWTK
jgi:hypothetical protein